MENKASQIIQLKQNTIPFILRTKTCVNKIKILKYGTVIGCTVKQ